MRSTANWDPEGHEGAILSTQYFSGRERGPVRVSACAEYTLSGGGTGTERWAWPHPPNKTARTATLATLEHS
jgi:hypothetical protein